MFMKLNGIGQPYDKRGGSNEGMCQTAPKANSTLSAYRDLSRPTCEKSQKAYGLVCFMPLAKITKKRVHFSRDIHLVCRMQFYSELTNQRTIKPTLTD
ncbi:hypothetical protein CEXT_475451 [Caerostris extrusa]|uniref:Uncharacterized protein n=1 Tax=Caerostris extrusa TaxID=172846 RepID=A0AAV4XCR7_CAEEX|nr:hypothetical protein CEXT_475451 [Caerostris extrusa]